MKHIKKNAMNPLEKLDLECAKSFKRMQGKKANRTFETLLRASPEEVARIAVKMARRRNDTK